MIKEGSSQLDLRGTKHSGVWTGVKVIKEEVGLGWGSLHCLKSLAQSVTRKLLSELSLSGENLWLLR